LAHLSESFERGANILISRRKGKIPHVNVSHVKVLYA
jgi:hypothetical protein